jgi:hypothetical protein
MADFQIFRNSVRATPSSGSGGTQSNELEAKIKSVTSSTTVGAVFVYDTRNDSDPSWRKRCQGLSWFDEDLNTATRGGRREFPSVALIVADNAAGSETITIYDLDDVAAPMWLVFQMGGANESLRNFSGRAGENANSLFAINGRVMWGINDDLVSGGVCIADFAADAGRRHGTLAAYTEVGRVLADRNSAILPQRMVGGLIVNSTVNDVAATVLEGAEIGALGLPIPTVAVATAGGTSVILASGTVNSSINTGAKSAIAFDEAGTIFASRHHATDSFVHVSTAAQYHSSAFGHNTIAEEDHTTVSGFAYGPIYRGSNADVAITNKGFAFGTDEGLNIYKHNTGYLNESAVAYITSDYNTGYMLGDIRFATTTTQTANLNNGANVYDQSVKGNTLTVNAGSGSYITRTKVATDAEMSAFSNFSADNYLSKAYTSDFDFGTGDFSIMFWCNLTSTSNTEAIIARYAPDDASPDWLLAKHSTDTIKFFTDGANAISTASAVSGRWAQVCVLRRGSSVEIYVDGKLDGSGTNAANLTNTSAVLGIGIIPTSSVSNPLASTSSLSLVRISATAPTPQQVKDIYEAEAPLFRAGAKCLLSQISFNDVNDLAYDNSSDLLYVGTKSGDAGDSVSTFRGLERVDTKDGQDLGWDGASANLVAAAGGVVGYARTSGTGGLVLDLPPFDVRGDTNIADSKLPDDGKLHFSGVTTDATPTVIGFVPIAENEAYTVAAKVEGSRYDLRSSGWNIFGEIKQSFYRNLGGDVAARDRASRLISEGTASLDFELVTSTGGSDSPANIAASSNYIMLKVTGSSSERLQWNATVEVQRISEKTYER